MNLSIVTTLYKSSGHIEEFYLRITKEVTKFTDDYEIIFVDDGSPDDSLKKAISLHNKDDKVLILELSRNFGHHKAIITGLSHAKGDLIFLIDCDLEERPELFSEFWLQLQENDELDLVYGIQDRRKGSSFEKLSGYLYYKFLNSFSGIKIPRNFLTIRLMRKNYVENLILFKEKELVFSVINSLAGFKSKEFVLKKITHSSTTYSFRMKLKLLLDTIVSATPKPLWMIFNLGLTITISSLLYLFFLIYGKLVNDSIVDGWTSVMVSISFFGGLIIFILGLLGLYLSQIFSEVKERPYSIIRRKYDRSTSK